ncbi:hypothetical protein RF55_20568, partial [Lasius niger]
MDQLIAAQHELHGRIGRTCENLRKAGAAKLSVPLVQSALANLAGKWSKFEEQHDRLLLKYGEMFSESEYNTSDFVSTVEMVYLQQRAKLLELEQTLTKATAAVEQRSVRAESAPSRNVLPRIQLPQFSGRFEDWPAFRDLFQSIVVEESSLSKVEKIHYLKTSVKGDAEQLIRNLPSTEDNF